MNEALECAYDPSRAMAQVPDHTLDVLLLDDSDFDLQRITRILKDLSIGVHILACKSLEEFKRALDTHVYDICLIDHHLGGGQSGKDALELIHTHKMNGFTPAVLISGNSDPKVIVDSIQSGFASFVDKDSLSAARLSQVVSEVLEEASHGNLSDGSRQRLLSRVLDEVAKTYADHTRPELTEIYKTVDFLRRCIIQRQLPDPSALDDIEEHCFRIWRFLDDYPNHGFGEVGQLH